MTHDQPLSPADIERALVDPSAVFATPEAVLGHAKLSAEQKIEILRRWAYDATEVAVAVEEGMRGEDNGLLRRILLALEQLGGGVDPEHTGPTKQDGLPSASAKSK